MEYAIQNPTNLSYGQLKFPAQFKNGDEIVLNSVEAFSNCDLRFPICLSRSAALDQINAKAATIAAKHYGSRDAMIEAGKKRNDVRGVVMSKLARESKGGHYRRRKLPLGCLS